MSETPELPPAGDTARSRYFICVRLGFFSPKFVHFTHFSHALPCLDGAFLQCTGSIWSNTVDNFLMSL